MSYNQSFAPQSGQGNLSTQFGAAQYNPNGASSPMNIPGHTRRQSSVSSGYGSYPPPHAGYGTTPPGGYATGPAMSYGVQGGGPYGTSPQQHMAVPPNQMPVYGSPSAQQAVYGSSPQHLHPLSTHGPPPPASGWNPAYGPQSYPPASYPPSGHRRSSESSYKSHHSSNGSPEKKHKSRRKSSVQQRYDSPRRPTMTDSVLAAWGGLKGAFDKRK